MLYCFADNGINGGCPYEFLTIRMNRLESRLASFFANGHAKSAGDLRPGDRIGVHYASEQDKMCRLCPAQMRAYRFR